MEEKKESRIKTWMKDNRHEVVTIGLITGAVAAYVGLIALAVKKDKKDKAAFEKTVSSALKSGKTIIPQYSGSFIIIDKEMLG